MKARRTLAWYVREFEKRERLVSSLARKFREAVRGRDAAKARLLEQGKRVQS